MTIFIDGFPFIDRIADTGGGSIPAASPGGSASIPETTLTTDPNILRGCYTSIPRYRLEIFFRGYFLTDRGNQLQSFDYRLVVHTKSLDEC